MTTDIKGAALVRLCERTGSGVLPTVLPDSER